MVKVKTPYLAVDIIIEVEGKGIVLIERRYPPLGWALPGGFVEYGETLEGAAIREAKEETGLDVTLKGQFYAYSDPERDPRQHTVSVVFIATANGEPKGADDAKIARAFPEDKIPFDKMVFDHSKILRDYLKYKKTGKRPLESDIASLY